MSDMPPGDPHIENVLAKVPGQVAKTLTPEQWEGFREALRQETTSSHLMNARFVLPLYFVRIYCVWILGKDRRERVEHILFERRRRAEKLVGALVLAAVAVLLIFSGFIVFYILKSAAGVDLIPDFHFGDFIPGVE